MSKNYLYEHGITYVEYLQSDHWKDVKKRFYASKLHNGSCYICGSREHLDVHHRSYVRLGNEKLSDLCLLCHQCHLFVHINNPKGKRLWRTTKKLKKRHDRWTNQTRKGIEHG